MNGYLDCLGEADLIGLVGTLSHVVKELLSSALSFNEYFCLRFTFFAVIC